jgi:predicted nucleotidyltransferase
VAVAKGGGVPTYAERCATRLAKLQAGAQAFAEYCATKQDIVALFAFGSFARRSVHPWSDLDLLIVRETSAPPLHRADDLYQEAPLRVGFDALVVTPDEYRERLPLTPFGRTILGQARRLYERQ